MAKCPYPRLVAEMGQLAGLATVLEDAAAGSLLIESNPDFGIPIDAWIEWLVRSEPGSG